MTFRSNTTSRTAMSPVRRKQPDKPGLSHEPCAREGSRSGAGTLAWVGALSLLLVLGACSKKPDNSAEILSPAHTHTASAKNHAARVAAAKAKAASAASSAPVAPAPTTAAPNTAAPNTAAPKPSAPNAPAKAIAAPIAATQVAAPAAVEHLVDLTPPTDTPSLQRWFRAGGCPLAARDGSHVLCWHHEEFADARHTVALHLLRAPGTLVKKFVVYEKGPASFDKAALRPANFAAVAAWNKNHGAKSGSPLRSAVKITHNRFTLLWEGVHWGMPLAKPPKRAPTSKLLGREGLCCRWAPLDATHFTHCGLAAVRLQLRCDWHVTQRNGNDVCFDASLEGKPVATEPTYAVHFVPVGGMGR